MRNFLKILIIPFLAVFLCAGGAMAYTIDDKYIGEEDYNYGDVIGSADDFQIYGADLSLSGTDLTVTVFTNFAGKADQGLFSSYTSSGKGIGYGDLFLTSAYDDTAAEATKWEYAFSLADRWSDSGTGGLYAIEGATVLNSENFMSGAIYRNGQEVAINPNNNLSIGTGSFSSETGNVSFTFSIAGASSLLSAQEIGIHWGMTCANDVIEGAAPVPEPATMLLLGTGLIGLATIGRRRFLKK